MKVLTAAEMREVDRRTIEAGIPGIVLMENAAHRVVEFLADRFAPLSMQRIAVLCGKGNNGGDGLAIARQLHARFSPNRLDVTLLVAPEDLKGDAACNYRMLGAAGGEVSRGISAEARHATLVIDALLGTGLTGPAAGPMLEGIREINHGFPLAKVVAVDIPSGMPSDSPESGGEFARADYTVTFTAPKIAHVLPPNCDHVGELVVGAIGSPASLYDNVSLSLLEPKMFPSVLAARPRGGHKGTFGHVLVVGGSPGKSGAAAMAGIAALRAGAGLVTVASSAPPPVPELMTGRLEDVPALMEGKTVIAIGPGLGRSAEMEALVMRTLEQCQGPMVMDADALALNFGVLGRGSPATILTPHPGEMSRLTGQSTAEIQKDRVGCARTFATGHHVTLVLKGQRTIIAFPDGRVWINPTGSPAMATGGTGDILTGLIAGFVAQFPHEVEQATAAAVYLHGLAGEIGARSLGEKSLIATDLLTYLPQALETCAYLPHRL
jgi:ADP-dependent NAD(P)H-hydrate dehydratase / NAD(P)H-hydrate epimerase